MPDKDIGAKVTPVKGWGKSAPAQARKAPSKGCACKSKLLSAVSARGDLSKGETERTRALLEELMS